MRLVAKTRLVDRIDFNAPITISFLLISIVALIVNALTSGLSNELIFSSYRSLDLMYPIRLITHMFGHADLNHFIGNMTMLLVLGPTLEEKYGSISMGLCCVLTSVAIGIVNTIFFPNIAILGASGIVFMMIMMASASNIKEGRIPFTMILVGCIYLGDELISGIFLSDNISNLSHILGGVCGICFGYNLSPRK